MAPREDTLIAEIERDALNESVPVATALRKCVVLGGKSGSEELRDWATRELKGYFGEDKLPAYRIVAAPLLIDAVSGNVQITRQQVSPTALPEVVRDHIDETVELRDGVGGIEALLQQSEIKLQPPGASTVVRIMNAESQNPYQSIHSLYWAISHAAIRGVLDQIRTALTQLVAELRANMSAGQEIPSADAANQAVSVVVTGRRSRVNVTTAQASGQATAHATGHADVRAQTDSSFWTRSRKIGAFIVGLATVAAAVFAFLQYVA